MPSASVIRCGFSATASLERDLQPVGDVGALLRRARALAEAAERPPPPRAARRRAAPNRPSNRSLEIGRVGAAEVEILEALRRRAAPRPPAPGE